VLGFRYVTGTLNPGGDPDVSTPTGAIRMKLMADNSEYQRLSSEHAHYAALLDELTSKRYLTQQEQLEEIRIKKMKLRLKDEMESLVHRLGSA
jgi:uncharacterized protein YdcH (DUF465 family)